MTALAIILEFKFPNIAGIRTRENARGEMEIFDWPLGATPDAAQIATWQVEYDARIIPELEPTITQVLDMLENKGLITAADRPRR